MADVHDIIKPPLVQELGKRCGWHPDHQTFPDTQQSLLIVISSLGNGSLGVVEQVKTFPGLPSFVRKRVQLPYHSRKQRLKIVKEESETLKGLDHVHIIKIIGSYEEGSSTGRQHFYSLLMYPVGDCDLRTYLDMVGDVALERDHSDVEKIDWILERVILLKWMRCLASALKYMHDQGIRHQDIKPSNIICREEEVYFTDFSSAARFNVGETTSTENPGRTSIMYAAPEIIDTDGLLLKHGRGTDVFALGAVFCEMLAVVNGSTVQEFQNFLLDTSRPTFQSGGDWLAQLSKDRIDAFGNNWHETQSNRTILYGKNTARIDEYYNGFDFYETCIHDMLAINRDHRPTAKVVVQSLTDYLGTIFRPSSSYCRCDDSSKIPDQPPSSESSTPGVKHLLRSALPLPRAGTPVITFAERQGGLATCCECGSGPVITVLHAICTNCRHNISDCRRCDRDCV